ncbi:hypothetical protein CPB97_002774 [Podila verticillata]|nr:hypothetical protein CPB97_002774 [Podila verticillata]
MAAVPPIAPLTGFTEIFVRGGPDYHNHCYQYASSSYPESLIQPMYIIYPKGDDEVIKAIKYAKDNKLAMAIRTGGHQYCGASSTSGNNIQLDLSNTYLNFAWEDDDKTLVTVGISYSLRTLHDMLAKEDRFVSHGQCSDVHLGGHVQTGGYGQLGRSFGLLADHVQKIRIINADGEVKEIRRAIVTGKDGQSIQIHSNEEEKDLFFAVLGGSPGNFGVLTDVTLRVHRDEDHPNSRGLRIFYPYDRNRLKRLLDVMVQKANDNSTPGDYDYCVTVLSGGSMFPLSLSPIPKEQILEEYPNIEGPDDFLYWPPMILVYAQWANRDGKNQPYNNKYFDEIKQAGDLPSILDGMERLLGKKVDDDQHIPLSELTGDWIFRNVREFEKPYVKRVYMSNSQPLQDGWTEDVCNRIDRIQADKTNGCYLSVQIEHFGGKYSEVCLNNDGSTAISWRDANICCIMDVFYDEDNPRAQNIAIAWQHENDASVGYPSAIFCPEDRRMLWGSHDLDLNQEHAHYFDNAVPIPRQTKYERLCRIKSRVDPNGVFTPNKFCVQAPPVTAVINDRNEAAQAPPVAAVINDREMAASLRSSRRRHGA